MEGLLWLLLLGVFFYVMMRWGCGAHMVHGHGGHGDHKGHDAGGEEHSRHAQQSTSLQSVTDPVCGMTVDSAKGYNRNHAGREYWFCSERCREQFDADPARYTA